MKQKHTFYWRKSINQTSPTTTTITSTITSTTTTTPWPFWLKIAHAQIEKCISLMVKSLRHFLLGRQVKRSRGAPPAPAVEYISPAPAMIRSVVPVLESIAPVPAVISSPEPVVEYLAPAPAVILSVSPVVEYIRQHQLWSTLPPVPAVL